MTNLVLVGSDVEGPVSFGILTVPTHGVLSGFETNSGAVIYTPATNYNGADQFQFTVSDGSLLATGTVSITVSAVNDAPVASNLGVSTPEDTATNLTLRGSDVEGPVFFKILDFPTRGELTGLNTNTGAIHLYAPYQFLWGGFVPIHGERWQFAGNRDGEHYGERGE